jgi:hypothetical protein
MTGAAIRETNDQAVGEADWARPLFERQIEGLGRLAEAGLEVALAIEQLAKAVTAETGVTTADVAPALAAFARVARAVRLTFMLQSKLIKQLQDWDSHRAYLASSAAWQAERERGKQADQRKAQVERIVERVAKGDRDDADEVERLVDETRERLDQDDIYGDVLSRPVSELVAMICRDLGLGPDWTRLAKEAWARDEMACGEAGWPLASEDRDAPEPALSESQPLGASP